jgi:hypothetical protein
LNKGRLICPVEEYFSILVNTQDYLVNIYCFQSSH